ncbi:hypothetical protein [Planctomycetes bacterium Poly30]
MPHRLRTLAVILLPALTGCAHKSLYAGYVQHEPSFDVVDADLSGASFGFTGAATKEARTRGFVQVDVRSDDDVGLDLVDFSFGGLFYAPTTGPVRPGLQLGLGLGRADLEGLDNSNSLVSLSVALRVDWQISERVGLYGLAGIRAYLDTTEPTTCNDGTTSTSVGQGTCSHHGGINHYNDYIGDSTEPEIGFGLTVSW